MDRILTVAGKVARGHGVASGVAKDNPYGQGTLILQTPTFEKLGIPMTHFFPGTINVDISPKSFDLVGWDYEAHQVKWTDVIPAEDFFFSRCKLIYHETSVDAMVYRPSPDTKVDQFQPSGIIEILAPKIESLRYGESVILKLNSAHCSITSATNR